MLNNLSVCELFNYHESKKHEVRCENDDTETNVYDVLLNRIFKLSNVLGVEVMLLKGGLKVL